MIDYMDKEFGSAKSNFCSRMSFEPLLPVGVAMPSQSAMTSLQYLQM